MKAQELIECLKEVQKTYPGRDLELKVRDRSIRVIVQRGHQLPPGNYDGEMGRGTAFHMVTIEASDETT